MNFPTINGLFYLDGVIYKTLNAAFTACNVSPGCNLTIPPGTYSFSTQIAPTMQTTITGSGAAFDNAGSHCTTTLQYTGTGAPFLFTGTGPTGSRLKDFCLYAVTGASANPVLIDIDNGASHIDLSNIVIDYNTTTGKVEPTVAAIRWGNTGNVNDSNCNSVLVRNTPMAFLLLNIQALWQGIRCRDIAGTATTGPEWQIGSAAAIALHVVCTQCSFGGGNVSPGFVSVNVLNAKGVHIAQSEWECGNAAAAYCLDVPSTATLAQGIYVSDATVFGQSIGGTALNAVFHTQIAGAQLTATNVFVGGSNFAASPKLVQNDSCSSITISGTQSVITSLAAVSSNAACVVSDMGSNYNGAINTQSGSGLIVLNNGANATINGKTTSSTFGTVTKCAAVGTTATPSVAACVASAAGVVSCNDTTNGVCQINTTAMLTANSTVIVTQDVSTTTGTLLSVTCNATPSVINPAVITAKVAATSFSFKVTAATDNPACFQYWIIN